RRGVLRRARRPDAPRRRAGGTRLPVRPARGRASVGVPCARIALMLVATGVSKSHGAEVVLADVDIVVPARARIGLVGPNGAGKSTLLRLLAGADTPDRGVIRRAGALAVGLLPQERDSLPGETLLEYLARRAGVAGPEREMDALAARLANEPEQTHAYTEALDAFLARGGGDLDARAEQVLSELDLEVALDRPLTALSGGEAARAALASILLSRFDVLLLDEPTNDLDFAGLARLEAFLQAYEGAAVIVSHDRAFLDRTVTKVVELDEWTHGSSTRLSRGARFGSGRSTSRSAGATALRSSARTGAARRRCSTRYSGGCHSPKAHGGQAPVSCSASSTSAVRRLQATSPCSVSSSTRLIWRLRMRARCWRSST